MGTHPIFESDFDCLTELPECSAIMESSRQLPVHKLTNNVTSHTVPLVLGFLH